jgi:pimeloyl-ACP methyl ester carboxylesterase
MKPGPGRLRLIVFLIIIGSAGLAYQPVLLRVRAASLLLRLQNPKDKSTLANFETYPVDESRITVPSGSGSIAARLYLPRNRANAPGMVIVHGVHHLGIEEPRLVAFSRAIASSGVVVLTPQLDSLADYHVDEQAIALIGNAARYLRQRLGKKVGVMGLSFSGGLALLAASDPHFASDIGFVVAIGAHDDLARVCRFFASNEIARPDGTVAKMPAHEYGMLVVVYSHIEDFFPPEDVPAAREALRLHLYEEPDAARLLAHQLTPRGQAEMALLLDHKQAELAPELLAGVSAHESEMARVSPHGKLGGVHVPVLLLHGSGDSVIPPTETLWLAKELPAAYLDTTLITPLITHVELGGKPAMRDKLALVNFIAEMLRQTE